MSLVSVVIPTFNSRNCIRHTIESVLAQTHDNIEIIVVDDGSMDDTAEVVRESLKRLEKNWRVLTLGKNMGPSAARNAGYLAAGGSWIQFLDSDDLLMPHKIELEMAVAAEATDDVAVVYSPWNWGFLEERNIEWHGQLKRPSVPAHPVMCLAEGRPLLGSSLVRRSALSEVGGFDEALRFWECEELNTRLVKVGSFVPVQTDLPQYLWRMRSDEIYIGGSGARYNFQEVALGWIGLAVKAVDKSCLQDLGLSESDRRLFLNECTLWGRLLYSHSRSAFKDYLCLARTLDPHMAPAYPRYISALSEWVGYEAAEGVARLVRQPRVWLRSALCRLGLRKPNMIVEVK